MTLWFVRPTRADGAGGAPWPPRVQRRAAAVLLLLAGCSAPDSSAVAEREKSSNKSLNPTIRKDSVLAGLASVPALNNGERYALLVGVSAADPLRAIPNPPHDVERMRRLLVDRFGFERPHVKILLDGDATRAGIIAAFRQHLGQAGPGGTAVFYFSGHGVPLESNLSVADDEVQGVDQALEVMGAGGAALLLDDELDVLLRELRAERRLIILDACYSGSGTKLLFRPSAPASKTRPRVRSHSLAARWAAHDVSAASRQGFISDGLSAVRRPLNTLLLAAADDGEPAYALEHWPTAAESRAIFGRFLVDALSAAADTERLDAVFARAQRATALTEQCTRGAQCQRPQLGGTLGTRTVAELFGRRRVPK